MSQTTHTLIGRDKLSPVLSKAGKEAEGLGNKFKTMAKVAVGALAGLQVADFLKDTIKAASDLGETTSKVGVIFGKEALPELQRFAAGAAKGLGQSKRSALDAAATFGVFGKSAGLAGGDLSKFSTSMVTLASDMASFGNTSPEEAIEAIGSALRGEAEPIRKYGVLLDDATLRNQALKLGLIDSVKEGLTPANKVLAAQAEILAQTSDAQGDFARTSEGLANQQRIAAAEFENAKVKLGGLLLPAITAAVSAFNEHFMPAVDGVIGALEGLGSVVGSVGGVIGDVFGAMPGSVDAAVISLTALALLGPKVKRFGDKLNTGISTPLKRIRDEARLQQHLGQMVGKEFSLAAGAAHSARARIVGFSKSLGGIKGAARGVTGFFGGPWGIALAGAGILLGALADKSAKAEERQRELADAGKSVAEAIREQNGVINETVARTAAEAAESAGFLTGLKDIGFAYGTVTDAILGQTRAHDQIREKLEAERKKFAELAGSSAGEKGNFYRRQAQQVIELRDGLDKLIGDKNADLAASKRVDSATKESTENREDEKKAVDRQKRSIDDLIAAKQEEAGIVLGARDAQRRYQEALDAAQESIKTTKKSVIDSGKALDIHTEQGRANQAALDDVAQAALDQAAALRANKAPAEKIKRVMGEAREKFYALARQMGLSKEEARKLRDKLLKLDGKYVADVHADTAPARKALNAFLDKYSGKQIKFQADMSAWLKDNAGLLPAAAGGQKMPGAPSSRDNMLAHVASGEWIINARSSQKYDALLRAINEDRLPAYALGGRYTFDAVASTDRASDQFEKGLRQTLGSLAASGGVSGVPTSVSGNAAVVKSIFADMFGWANHWASTYRLLMKESGFRNTAQNPTSTAYGMFQFLDSTWAGTGIGKTSDPRLQTIAGGRYIDGRYGNPSAALQFHLGHNWYDDGGWLMPGATIAVNGTRKPERILGPQEKIPTADDVGRAVATHLARELSSRGKFLVAVDSGKRAELLLRGG